MLRRAIVPDHHIALAPAPAHGVFQPRHIALQDVVNPLRFGRRHAQDALDEPTEQQIALAAFGMHAHHGMFDLVNGRGENVLVQVDFALGRLGPLGGIVIGIAVDRAQPVGEQAQFLGQVLIGRRRVRPHRVAARCRDRHRAQDRSEGIAINEGHVGMPLVGAATELGIEFKQEFAAPARHRRMRDRLAEALAKRLMARIVEMVLPAKEQHLVAHQRRTHRCQRGVVEVGAQSQAAHLRADQATDRMDIKNTVGVGCVEIGIGRRGHGKSPRLKWVTRPAVQAGAQVQDARAACCLHIRCGTVRAAAARG
ncbi:hypothetical protein D9M73_134450 [compost metagenome]